jgi:hypothetical protein
LAVKQLEGIGSSLSVPTRDGRIMVAAGRTRESDPPLPRREEAARPRSTLARPRQLEPSSTPSNGNGNTAGSPLKQPRNVGAYKIHCPACDGELAFMEGCAKCHACGFSQC